MLRQQPQAWWVVYLIACIAMTVFISFEVLDLDGSSLKGSIDGTALAVETTGGEAERLLHSIPPALTSECQAALLRRCPNLVSSLPGPLASTTPHQPRRSPFRPRGDMNGIDSSGASGPSDPA